MKCLACRKDAPTVTDARSPNFIPKSLTWKVVAARCDQNGSQTPEIASSQHDDFTWWTHKIKGLHSNDFIMAAKTDELYQP